MGVRTQLVVLGWIWVVGAAGCTYVETIGFRTDGESSDASETDRASETVPSVSDRETEPLNSDTGSDPGDTGSETFDTETSDGTMFPLIFDFDGDPDGFQSGQRPGWTWNASDGTFVLDTSFSKTPEWAIVELYASLGVWPGGLDWGGAVSVEFRMRVDDASGGYFRAYIQSIEQESETAETWLWYATDYSLIPDGAWRTVTLDLTAPDAPLNLEEVTKLGVQIHAPEDALEQDTSLTEVQLNPPVHVRLVLDSVIVRGAQSSP